QYVSTLLKLHSSNRLDNLRSILKKFISQKESEIETICNKNYQEFVSSVEHLSSVRTEARKVKEDHSDLFKKWNENAGEIYETKKEIYSSQKVQTNLNETVANLKNCLTALKCMQKAQMEMGKGKFYQALKTMDDLQMNKLKEISSFKIAQKLEADIPRMRNEIKKIVLDQVKDWMTSVREKSKIVGELALELTKARKNKLETLSPRLRGKLSHAKNATLELIVHEEIDCML
ncbi:hypothetical protein ROZALSC1DRAFT_30319, partial [Rozella allomycis CSF55]